MLHILGTYVMFLDIGKDNDDIMMTDNLALKITISNLQITLSRHYEIRKDLQKYGQRPCKNCEKVRFLVKWNLPFY